MYLLPVGPIFRREQDLPSVVNRGEWHAHRKTSELHTIPVLSRSIQLYPARSNYRSRDSERAAPARSPVGRSGE
jgi:hypothetical protein